MRTNRLSKQNFIWCKSLSDSKIDGLRTHACLNADMFRVCNQPRDFTPVFVQNATFMLLFRTIFFNLREAMNLWYYCEIYYWALDHPIAGTFFSSPSATATIPCTEFCERETIAHLCLHDLRSALPRHVHAIPLFTCFVCAERYGKRDLLALGSYLQQIPINS